MSNSYFSFKQFTLHQEQCAMKVGTDGTLLGAWAGIPTSAHPAEILDAGTGTGLIALMMAQRFAEATIRAIDIDAGAVAQATGNILSSPFFDRITVEQKSLQSMNGMRFDAIVCNPPYFVDSLTCPDYRRTLARHAATLTYDDLAAAAIRLLTDGGELSVVVPSECLGHINSAAAISGLFPKRICSVKTTERKPAKRHLLAYSNQRPETGVEETTLVIGSDEYECLMRDFYLKL